jgi:virulence factor Mce-like protein
VASTSAGQHDDADYALGHQLASQGDLAGAEEAFRAADARGHPAAAASLGLIAEARGDLESAASWYRRADERGDKVGGVRLGLLLSGDGRWDEAREVWARADQREELDDDDRARELEASLLGDAVSRSAIPSPGRRAPPLSNPVLIGAVTVLIAILGVFLAYNSNRGLPFLPTKQIRVDFGDGANITVGSDVREGGFLVGLVSSMRPVTIGAQTVARFTLKIRAADATIPVDSRFSINSKSLLGLKYVSIIRGTSHRDLADGALVPVSRTNVPIQLDTVFDTFNPPTRRAVEHALVGTGDALTGRGSGLNDTFHALPSLLGHLRPVARTLSAPSTRLTPFLVALRGLTTTIKPVAPTLAHEFGDLAETFGAISRSPVALERTIARSPSTLAVSTASLRTQQPFLTDLTSLGRALTPATVSLRSALPATNPALEQGTRVLPRTVALDLRLRSALNELRVLAQTPGTNIAINGLGATVQTLDPMLRYLGPFVTVCNDWNYWWTYLAGDLDEATSFGYAQRALLMLTNPIQPNNVGTLQASNPVNGGAPNTLLGGDEYLHAPNYGAAIDTHGNADCETGQRGYPLKLNSFDPLGRNLVTDPHVPGNQGPTFTGSAHVPRGETFSRTPLTGPQTQSSPQNP